MTITLTEKAETASTSQASSYATTPSYVPTAGTPLIALVGATGTVDTNPGGSGNSATWTRERLDIFTTSENAVFWATDAVSTPGSFTYTLPTDAGTGACIYVVEAAGASTSAPILHSQFELGSADTTPAITLDDPVTAGNAVLVAITAFNLAPLGAAFTSAGFTEMSTSGGFGYSSPVYQMQVFKHENPGAISSITADGTLSQAWRMTVVEVATGTQGVTAPLINQSGVLYDPVTQTTATELARNTFDGGTNGSTITTGNSGGGSGDAWDSVLIGAGATLTYDSANALHGPLCAAVNPAASVVDYLERNLSTLTDVYGRVYVKLSALPGSNMPFIDFRDSGTALNRGRLTIQTDGRIRLIDSAGTTQATTPTTTGQLTAGSYARIEWHFVGHATTGSIEVKMFVGANLEGTSASSTTTASNINTTGSINRLRQGQTSSVASDTAVFYLDQESLSTTGYPGPYVATDQTVTAPLLDQSAVQFTPRMNRTLTAPLIDQSAVGFAPTVAGTSGQDQAVSVPLLAFGWDEQPWDSEWNGGGAVLFSPAVGPKIGAPLLDQSGVLFAPSVNPDYVTDVPLIDQSAVGFNPQVNMKASMPLLDNSGVLYEMPRVGAPVEIDPDLIDNTAVVYAPSINPKEVDTPLLDQSGVAFDPQANFKLSVPLLDNSAVAYDPQSIAPGIAPPLLDNSGVLFEPGFSQRVDSPLIDQSGVLYAPEILPNVDRDVDVPLFDENEGQVFEPVSVTQGAPPHVDTPLLDQSAILYHPRIWNPLMRQFKKTGRYRPTIHLQSSYRPVIRLQAREASLIPERSPITLNDGFFVGEDQSVVWDIPATDVEGLDLSEWTSQFRMARTQDGTSILTKAGTIDTDAIEVEVSFAAADTSALAPGTYYYTLSRTNSGQNTVLAFGKCVLQARVQ